MPGNGLLVRDGDVARNSLRAERGQRALECIGVYVEHFVRERNACGAKRGVLKAGRNGVRNRMTKQDQARRRIDHDAPGTRSAASRSKTRRISASSSSAVAR